MGGCITEIGEGGPPELPAACSSRRDEVEILDTWTVSGLCGTGSHDIAVDGLRVPGGALGGGDRHAPRRDGAAVRVPSVRAAGRSRSPASALGIARGGDRRPARAGRRQDARGQQAQAGRAADVQAEIARAEAALRAARALLSSDVDARGRGRRGGGEIARSERAALRLAATHATRSRRGRGGHVPTSSAAAPRSTDEPPAAPLPRRARGHPAHADRALHVGAHRPAAARSAHRHRAALARDRWLR